MILESEIEIKRDEKGRENRNEKLFNQQNCIKMFKMFAGKFSHFQEHQECLNFQQVL